MKPGTRVTLREWEDEGRIEPEQKGTVLGGTDPVMVELDKRFRDGPHDDGLREVSLDQIEILKGGAR
ncbi:MAG: hypothetical protein MIO87_01275 [Methanomassiliicoccales archaeon]|nr:hypothetical protein [Methanomassiliicoccales archaeon]